MTKEHLIPAKPGEVRNPNGYNQYVGPEGKRGAAYLREAFEKKLKANAQEVVDTMWRELQEKSANQAVNNIWDRAEGKPEQKIKQENTGNGIVIRVDNQGAIPIMDGPKDDTQGQDTGSDGQGETPPETKAESGEERED